MTTTNYSSVSSYYEFPEVFITKDKNRIKKLQVNNQSTVYLNDQDRFEIELYNPNSSNILAKIKINGNYISIAGIVIKPAQRIFLDRFIDTNNKFIFETYQVDNNATVKDIIQNNGVISVEFYMEIVRPHNSWVKLNTPWTYTINYGGHNNFNTHDTTRFDTHDTTRFDSYCTSGIEVGASFKQSDDVVSSYLCSNPLETGRVEKGEKSSTEFKSVSGDYSNFPFFTTTINILPTSQQPIDITQVKQYCTTCGYKIRKDTWKFCPKCGGKL